jgi:ketosteroid isomerase-like protein
VDVVERSFQAWNRDDWEGLRELYDPAVVARPPEEWPESAPIEGFEALRGEFARYKEGWESEHVEVDEVRALGPSLVLAQIRWVTTNQSRGLAFETPITELLTVCEGRIVRVDGYLDRDRALAAARLQQ